MITGSKEFNNFIIQEDSKTFTEYIFIYTKNDTHMVTLVTEHLS